MATGTAQLFASKDDNYVSLEEDVDGGPNIPEPVKDGLPQVSKETVTCNFVLVCECMFACMPTLGRCIICVG